MIGIQRCFLIFLWSIIAVALKGQSVPITYTFPDSIIKNGDNQDDVISQNLATSGYYKSSLQWEDKQHSPNMSHGDSSAIISENALKQIIRLAKDARVVLINEGHNLPDDRCFILQVLQVLKSLGFNAYGAETFMWRDKALARRKYPVDTSGYYTREPVYGELVREAAKMGYEFFPYEDSLQDNTQQIKLDTLGSFMFIYPDLHDTTRLIVKPNGEQSYYPGKAIEYREINQAKNIMSYLRAHPNAKAVIHVGYGHLCLDRHAMGFHLDTALSEKILSIDQERFREHSDTIFEEPFYRRRHFNDYTAFVDSIGVPTIPSPKSYCKVNVCVAHPRTQYINGRPDWLYKMPGRKAYPTKSFNRITAPSVLVAYYAAEYEASKQHAVPIDVLELSESSGYPPLLLRKGLFTVIQIGRNGEKERYEVKVE